MACSVKTTLLLAFCVLVGLVSSQDATKKIGKIKAPTPKTPNTIINEATEEELEQIVDEHEHVAVLFYEKLDKKTQRVLSEMEDMETEDLDISIVRYLKLLLHSLIGHRVHLEHLLRY